MTDVNDPIEMLREIEAYLCFCSGPIPESEWRAMRYDIAHLLHVNGLKGYERAREKRVVSFSLDVSQPVSQP